MFKLQFVIALSLLRLSSATEITVCNCLNPIFIGIIDTSIPDYCSYAVNTSITPVVYEEISKVAPPLTEIGYLCRKWLRVKTIDGFFFGGFDTVYQQIPYDVSPEECVHMYKERKCESNIMEEHENGASFSIPPTGEGRWMCKVEHSIFNCELEIFQISQDCPECPIHSPFGILVDSKDESNIPNHKKGHLTYVWNKPNPSLQQCNFKIIRSGIAYLHNSSNPSLRHLRDEENQLEFIFGIEEETVCNFQQAYKAKSIPDTYIRFAPTKNKQNNSNSPSKSYLQGSLLLNKESGLCIGNFKPTDSRTNLRAVDCNDEKAEYFKFANGRLTPITTPNLCVSFINESVIYYPCVQHLDEFQIWSFNEMKGVLKNQNACLSLVTSYIHRQSPVNTRPYGVAVTPCNGSNPDNHQTWKFLEKEIAIMQNDAPAIAEEVSHHQYIDDTFIGISNILNNEVRNAYCESFRTKQFSAITLSQLSPMLAGIALGLPTCQRVTADGQIMIVEKCKITKESVNVTKTDCGFEPIISNGYTVGRDGFTRQPFQPCTWINNIANLNGKAYQFSNGSWNLIPPNIRISSVGIRPEFEQIVDKEATYLKNLETSFHSKEFEQSNVIGELMAIMKHDKIDSLSKIIFHPQTVDKLKTFTDWLWIIKVIPFVIGSTLLIYLLIRCKLALYKPSNNTEQPDPIAIIEVPPNTPVNSPVTRVKETPVSVKLHSHNKPQYSKSKGYIWEDGCSLFFNDINIENLPPIIE